MDNRDLVQWAQRLYLAIVDADLPPQQLRDVAGAIRSRAKWSALAPDVKLAIMRMAVRCQPDGSGPDRVIDLPAEAVREASANDNNERTERERSVAPEDDEPKVA
jgi:hypothetical protein